MEFERLVISREDKEIKKKVLTYGNTYIVPYESARCKISLTEVSVVDNKVMPENIPKSLYLDPDFEGKIMIGNCDNFIDRDIDLLVQQMCEKEVCLAEIIYKDATGNIAKEVKFKIELLEVKEIDLVSDWSWSTILNTSMFHKVKGCELVKEKQYLEAFTRFSKALKFIIALEPVDKDTVGLDTVREIMLQKINIYNNLALCQLHFQEYEATLELCNKALQIDSHSVKALYRRCCAYEGLKMYDEAWNDLQLAITLDHTDKVMQKKKDDLKPIIDNINAKYANVIKKMFG